MTVLLFSLIALLAYGLGTTAQMRLFFLQAQPSTPFILILGTLAATCHLATNFMLLSTPAGFDFSVLKSASLICNVIILLLLLLTLRKPLYSLFLIGFPLAFISLLLAVPLDLPTYRVQQAEFGILLHASLSIVSYSIFSLAALHALLLYTQNKQLKAHTNSRLIKALPPLQTMETMLFEILWAGFILLTLSILSGAVFIDDLFAQHLVHKTAFSLLAWIIFAILLGGRHIYGWRGLTASRWTLGGALLLMLGYLGSKLVLEMLLRR